MQGEKANKFWLSIVAIGRNEAGWLPGLFRSLPKADDIEWIYVDSLSTDGSAAVAAEYGAKVLTLEAHPSLYPAAGRYAGTREAAGRWILYLDGDMALRGEFVSFLQRLRNPAGIPKGTAGFVGKTGSIFYSAAGEQVSFRDDVCRPAGRAGRGGAWGCRADFHGGAVLYLREAVLKAGNWNPALRHYEEIELYSRIMAAGWHLRALDLPMADHHTPALTWGQKLRLSLLPKRWGGGQYGFGQIIAARLKQGSLGSFIRYFPYPFVVMLALLLSIPGCLLWKPAPLFLNLAALLWITCKKKWYLYLVYLGMLIQAPEGIVSYRPFIPSYRLARPPHVEALPEGTGNIDYRKEEGNQNGFNEAGRNLGGDSRLP